MSTQRYIILLSSYKFNASYQNALMNKKINSLSGGNTIKFQFTLCILYLIKSRILFYDKIIPV